MPNKIRQGPQIVRWRPQVVSSYIANNTDIQYLGRGNIYRDLSLNLSGQLTLAKASNTTAKTKRGDEWGVVKQIQVIVNGGETIRTFTGNELWMLNALWYGRQPELSVELGDSNVDDPKFSSTLIIPFWILNSIKPLDTMLDSRRLSELRIEIQWGNETSINADATGFTTEPSIAMNSQEVAGLSGPFSAYKIIKLNNPCTGANSALKQVLPVGPLYRSILINTVDTNGVDKTGLVTNFRLVSGTNVFYDRSEVFAREIYRRTRNIQPITRIGDDNVPDAWYMLDFVEDGYNTEAINSLGLAELFLEFNTSAACGINILASQIYPLASA